MKGLIEKNQETFQAFVKDAKVQFENDNTVIGALSRKTSLELEKAMKEFRKASHESKK